MYLCSTELGLGLQVAGPTECGLQQVDIYNCGHLGADHGEGQLLKNTLFAL